MNEENKTSSIVIERTYRKYEDTSITGMIVKMAENENMIESLVKASKHNLLMK